NALAVRVHGQQLRHALIDLDRHRRVLEVARHAAFAVAREIEIEVDRTAPLQVSHVDAGLAEALHGHQAHHDARPGDSGLVAAGAAVAVAPAAGRQVNALAAPFARQRAYVFGRHAGFGFLPFRRLGNAVIRAEQIGLPFVETDGVAVHVLRVVETFL